MRLTDGIKHWGHGACKSCASTNLGYRLQVVDDNKTFVRCDCLDCGAFVGYCKQWEKWFGGLGSYIPDEEVAEANED